MRVVLLDTTFLIDAERQVGDLDALIDDEDDVAIAAITVAELLVGVELASPINRETREVYVDDVVASIPIIPYDRDVAVEHARLLVAVRQAGRPRRAHDLLIAATARAGNRVVITADESAFDDLPGVRFETHRSSKQLGDKTTKETGRVDGTAES
ncbi:MAG: PIN domain-containing protein [Acidimicrobiia bacterium]